MLIAGELSYLMLNECISLLICLLCVSPVYLCAYYAKG